MNVKFQQIFALSKKCMFLHILCMYVDVCILNALFLLTQCKKKFSVWQALSRPTILNYVPIKMSSNGIFSSSQRMRRASNWGSTFVKG